jgi:hypothetical protein
MRWWYAWLRNGPIVRSYHRSGVASWKFGTKMNILGILPTGFHAAVWMFGLFIPFLIVVILVQALLPISFEATLSILALPFLALVFPLLMQIFADAFRGYFAIVQLTFNRPDAADAMLTYHQTKLAELAK